MFPLLLLRVKKEHTVFSENLKLRYCMKPELKIYYLSSWAKREIIILMIKIYFSSYIGSEKGSKEEVILGLNK